MSNKEQRGNREAKKPKKDKIKSPPVAATSLEATVNKMSSKSSGGKKK